MATPAADIAILIILTQDMFRAFLMGYFLMQCETPKSRFYKALRIVVRNPGKPYFQNQPVK
jgi:hypothetical protein